jgi:hypothetical protein
MQKLTVLTINEGNSWFFNFTLETDPSLPVKEVRKPVFVDISDRRPSQRTEKLTRSTAGKQTHLKPQIISGNRRHGKSALTLYLEDKNALYDSYRAKYNTYQESLRRHRNQRILK